MYILTTGLFDLTTSDLQSYIVGPDVDSHDFPDTGYLIKWLSEFALFTPWVHKDRLVACKSGEVVLIAREPLLQCLDTVPEKSKTLQEEHEKRYERVLVRYRGHMGDWTDRDRGEEELKERNKHKEQIKTSLFAQSKRAIKREQTRMQRVETQRTLDRLETKRKSMDPRSISAQADVLAPSRNTSVAPTRDKYLL
jgi:hypothetical protein